MLNYRNTNIVFTCALVVILYFDQDLPVPFAVYGVLLLLYVACVFYGCYFVDSNFFMPIACFAVTERKEIAISFDDGPIPESTPAILQVLKKHHVKAAFFCIGKRISGNEAILRQVLLDGHLVGNHSYSHDYLFDFYPYRRMAQDLEKMDDEMERVTGIRPKLFRPPYGVMNPNLRKAIINGGYTPVGWSVRSMDTVVKNEFDLLFRLCRDVRPGAVYLFHDTSEATLTILALFIEMVKSSGYEFVRLDRLLNVKAYA